MTSDKPVRRRAAQPKSRSMGKAMDDAAPASAEAEAAAAPPKPARARRTTVSAPKPDPVAPMTASDEPAPAAVAAEPAAVEAEPAAPGEAVAPGPMDHESPAPEDADLDAEGAAEAPKAKPGASGPMGPQGTLAWIESQDTPELRLRLELVEEALSDIPFEGFSLEAVQRAAERQGLDRLAVDRAFPNGVASLLDAFNDLMDRMALQALIESDAMAFGIAKTLRMAILSRFRALDPHREALNRANRLVATRPDLGVQLPGLIWRTADRFWRAAGDDSTDFNHYSKRAILSGVMTATGARWLQAGSTDDRVERFLDQRLLEVRRFGEVTQRMRQAGERLSGLNPFRAVMGAASRFYGWRYPPENAPKSE